MEIRFTDSIRVGVVKVPEVPKIKQELFLLVKSGKIRDLNSFNAYLNENSRNQEVATAKFSQIDHAQIMGSTVEIHSSKKGLVFSDLDEKMLTKIQTLQLKEGKAKMEYWDAKRVKEHLGLEDDFPMEVIQIGLDMMEDLGKEICSYTVLEFFNDNILN